MTKPPWLTIRVAPGDGVPRLRTLMRSSRLHTVCEEAHCPNMQECWSGGTATFMLMGDVCTRGCRFCHVSSGTPGPLDAGEPENILLAAKEMQLSYVVLTSVDRDDLPDQGAGHFAEAIRLLKQEGFLVEALIPDFRGETALVSRVIAAGPDVLGHNIETVSRLQGRVRDRRANYEQSLKVLRHAKGPGVYTKSSLMLGLGETEEEILATMDDLLGAGVSLLTLGQYLRPSRRHLPVAEYVRPEVFAELRSAALQKGFLYCAAGPFVRSSYRAGELFMERVLRKISG